MSSELTKQIAALVLKHIKRGATMYRVAKDAGMSQTLLKRFLEEGKTLTIPTAERLMGAVGYDLRPVKRASK